MARIIGYIASSLDGFIVDSEGSLQWLYEAAVELGPYHYNEFIKRIATVVMGRATWDWLVKEGMTNPYPKQRTIVVTSHPLTAPPQIEAWSEGVASLIGELRGLDTGDVWMLGGGQLQMAFMERGALDEIEIYVMPRLIGGGAPLFPPTGFKASPKLLSAKELGGGGVRLHYAFGAQK
jgi:dihydrofolate reductase